MAPKNKINLKDRLEDGELDLSLSELQEIPVREIAAMKKATSLDVSNNRLTSLGKNFTILTHIIKLDLSQNLLTELPENFGDMKQLRHLDLYSNKLTHLPLSFHQLKALRWLDLKNNPLVPAVAKVAGPCLDAQHCTQCARSIVTFFSQMFIQVEEEKQRREQQRQAQLAVDEMRQQKQEQKKKEKKKVVKVKKGKVKTEKKQETVNEVQEKIVHSSSVKAPVKNGRPAKNKKSNLSFTKFLFYTLLVLPVAFFVFTTLKTECAVNLKQKTVEVWGGMVEVLPSSWNPWITQFNIHVQNVHSMTGKMVENLIVYAEDVKKDERVKNIIQMLSESVVFIAAQCKRFFIAVGDQAVIVRNEIKKIIVENL